MKVLLLLATLVVAGCAEPGTQVASPAEPAAPGDAAAAPPEPASVDPMPPEMEGESPTYTTAATRADVTSTGPDAPILHAVRTAGHDGFDRIVFEFDSVGLPQWEVSYVAAPIIQCGSGHAMPVEGTAWLQVRFSGANAHTEAGEGTSGPMRRTPGLVAVRELVRTCDFEAEVTWVAGLAGKAGYRTQVLADPARLVVDVAH